MTCFWKEFYKKEAFWIIVACIIPNLGGLGGSMIVTDKDNMDGWYEKLKLPSFRPPNWVFGPVWTYLYITMGYAAYRVYKAGGGFTGKARVALSMFIIQLLLNWAWTPIFFGFHLLKVSAIEIVVLTLAVYMTTYFFFKIDRIAGYLFIPYILWVTFASYLNYWIFRENTPANSSLMS